MFQTDHQIPLKSPRDLDRMRESCRLLADAFKRIDAVVAPGITTMEVNQVAHETLVSMGAVPAFLNLYGFPASICISVNEELVHGIPNRKRVLREGDIVSVDMGAKLRGWYADRAHTYAVGKISDEAQRLIDVTKRSFWVGASFLEPGRKLGDAQYAVQRVVEEAGFHIVRKYVGHGIGRRLHEPPQVANFGKPGTGIRLKPGMVLAVEPMVGYSTGDTMEMEDGWTVVMVDQGLSAHYEHTVAITENGPEVLTLAPELAETLLNEARSSFTENR
jgi:methionyl aminopeptidase